jgi:hypothetical protein
MSITIIFMLTMLVSFNYSQSDTTPAPGDDQNPKWDDLSEWPLKDFHPMLEGNYGVGIPRQKLFEGEFEDYGYLEAKLGFSKISIYKKFVLNMDERYFFGSYSNKDQNLLDSKADPAKVKTEMIRFGLGNRLGYGYKIGFISLLPYQQSQIAWSKVTSEHPEELAADDLAILERYEGAYHFGLSTEGGVKIELFESIAVTGGYEAAVIYPRFVFFPWLGGIIVETFIVGGVSFFAESIVANSNVLGPLFYAVLRNAAAYGVYVGLKDEMYWPVNSETPLTHETFKLGLSLTF